MASREYSKRLGRISDEQLQAAASRFGLGRLISAEPTSSNPVRAWVADCGRAGVQRSAANGSKQAIFGPAGDAADGTSKDENILEVTATSGGSNVRRTAPIRKRNDVVHRDAKPKYVTKGPTDR